MALLSKSNIQSGNVIQASDLTNVYDALGGSAGTDIIVSGSLSAFGGISLSGDIIPQSACAYDLGSASFPFKDLHMSGGTLFLYTGSSSETLSFNNVNTLKQGRSLVSGKAGQFDVTTIRALYGNTFLDTETNIAFLTNNRITHTADDNILLDLDGGSKYVKIGEQQNFIVTSDGQVGIGTSPVTSNTGSTDVSISGDVSITGGLTATQNIKANKFFGDGSNITGVTAEWDGTHSSSAFISGNLGIGTSLPKTKLHVEGSISATTNITANSTVVANTVSANTVSANTVIANGDITTLGNVGIGTTPTSYKFEVYNGPLNRTVITTDGNMGFGTTTPQTKIHVHQPGAGSKDVFVVTSGGKVGIGTTNPLGRLHIRSSNPVNESPLFVSTGGTVYMGTTAGGGLHTNLFVKGNAIVTDQFNCDSIWGTTMKANTYLAALQKVGIGSFYPQFALDINFGNSANRVAITTGGKVGIGTTNPLGRLHVHSASSVGIDNVFTVTTDGNVGIGTTDPLGRFQIYRNTASQQVLVTSGGSVGIGITNQEGTDKLAVCGDIRYGGTLRGPVINSTTVTVASTLGINSSLPLHPLEVATPTGIGMFVRDTGRVGIGTKNPYEALHVYANSLLSGSVTAGTTTSDMSVINSKLFVFNLESSVQSSSQVFTQTGSDLGLTGSASSTKILCLG